MKTVILAAMAVATAAPALAQVPPQATMPTAVAPATNAAPAQAPIAATPAPTIPVPPLLPARQLYRPPSPAELRVRAANRAATLEPATGGYLNAAQVYPYSDGAIYHVFTAPGQVTDVARRQRDLVGHRPLVEIQRNISGGLDSL